MICSGLQSSLAALRTRVMALARWAEVIALVSVEVERGRERESESEISDFEILTALRLLSHGTDNLIVHAYY